MTVGEALRHPWIAVSYLLILIISLVVLWMSMYRWPRPTVIFVQFRPFQGPLLSAFEDLSAYVQVCFVITLLGKLKMILKLLILNLCFSVFGCVSANLEVPNEHCSTDKSSDSSSQKPIHIFRSNSLVRFAETFLVVPREISYRESGRYTSHPISKHISKIETIASV